MVPVMASSVQAQPIELEKSEMRGQEATSGFVDEKGNPISQADYDKIRAENEKGLLEKYPVIIYAVLGGVGGAVIWLVVNMTNLKKK